MFREIQKYKKTANYIYLFVLKAAIKIIKLKVRNIQIVFFIKYCQIETSTHYSSNCFSTRFSFQATIAKNFQVHITFSKYKQLNENNFKNQ